MTNYGNDVDTLPHCRSSLPAPGLVVAQAAVEEPPRLRFWGPATAPPLALVLPQQLPPLRRRLQLRPRRKSSFPTFRLMSTRLR